MARTLTIIGLDEVIAGLASESMLAEARGASAVAATAKKVEASAKSMAPKRTGALAGSIRTDMVQKTIAEIGPTLYYGLFMEFGTYKDSPQPFMGPALDTHGPGLENELANLVGVL